MNCTCGGNVEFTVGKDMASKVIILQGCCEECGRTENGFGMTVEQALDIVKRKWRKNGRNKQRRV